MDDMRKTSSDEEWECTSERPSGARRTNDERFIAIEKILQGHFPTAHERTVQFATWKIIDWLEDYTTAFIDCKLKEVRHMFGRG